MLKKARAPAFFPVQVATPLEFVVAEHMNCEPRALVAANLMVWFATGLPSEVKVAVNGVGLARFVAVATRVVGAF